MQARSDTLDVSEEVMSLRNLQCNQIAQAAFLASDYPEEWNRHAWWHAAGIREVLAILSTAEQSLVLETLRELDIPSPEDTYAQFTSSLEAMTMGQRIDPVIGRQIELVFRTLDLKISGTHSFEERPS